jgi:hypothetical protein
VQAHAIPGEGDPQIVLVITYPTGCEGVQRSVQQRRVKHKTLKLTPMLLGQLDLGEQLLTTTPRRTQPLERRTVFQTPLQKSVI